MSPDITQCPLGAVSPWDPAIEGARHRAGILSGKLAVSLCYRWESRGPERGSNLPKVTQPARSRLETQAQSPTPCVPKAPSGTGTLVLHGTLTSAGPVGPGALRHTTNCRPASLSLNGRRPKGLRAACAPASCSQWRGCGAQGTCVSRAGLLPHMASHSGGHRGH